MKVRRAGFLTTVQDIGRTGYREVGVSLSGAADEIAFRASNLLVGNDESAAGLEFTHGKVCLQTTDEHLVAWAGGDYEVKIGSVTLPPGHAAFVVAGDEIHISGPRAGARGWLALSGGVAVPLVLGSRSTDRRGRFGGFEGRALKDGDEIILGTAALSEIAGNLRSDVVSTWSAPRPWVRTFTARPTIRFVRGTDWSRFGEEAHKRFQNDTFTVSADSDRMGARLNGCPLTRVDSCDLISEAVAPGTIQVPPDGNPLILLNDCQTIGGYPKIAHVIAVDMPIVAQLRAGDEITFREVSLEGAQAFAAARAREFDRFRVGIQMHYS